MSNLTERLIETYRSHPTAAIIMSGKGSNAEAILSDQRLKRLYDIHAVVTDNEFSNAEQIAIEHGLQPVVQPTDRFADASERKTYFDQLTAKLRNLGVRALFYAGFMKISTTEFCEEFLGVNVHPADLTIKDADGLPKYRGMRALPDMRRELGFVRSTVHVVEARVDSGVPLALTQPLYPLPGESDTDLHFRLKALEHATFTETLFRLGSGSLDLVEAPIEVVNE